MAPSPQADASGSPAARCRAWSLARRKSELGVEHPHDGWALGHSEGGPVVALSDWEMRHHTLVCGATGAGKTSVLLLLMEAVADRYPIVVVDFKASQVL